MGKQKLAGFTIIETMLFLAISGFLMIALLVGTGASVNVQRYRDSTETFKSLLQQQYADLTSTQNGRDDNWSCGSSATPTTTGPTKDNRGQSDCMLVGKYVRIQDTDIAVYSLIGYKKTTPTVQPNDIASLKNNYVLNISKLDASRSKMEWGTRVAYPSVMNDVTTATPKTPRTVGFLVVRSPDSGQIYTFSNNDPNVPPEASINAATFVNLIDTANQGSQLICIDNDGMFASNDRGVYVHGFASGVSAIEVRSNDYMKTIAVPPAKADAC